MRKWLHLLVCLIPFFGNAQNEYFDSLRTRISIEKNDTEKVRLLVQLGNKIHFKDTAESWRCQRQIQNLATVLKNDYFQGQAHFLAGTIHRNNQTILSLSNYEQAEKIFLKFPNNKRAKLSLGSTYINLGLLHNNNNDYETAAYYYLEAEKIYLKENPRSSDLAILYSNLSITYGTINKYDEGITYSSKGLELARKSNDAQNLLNALYSYGGNWIVAKRGGDSGLRKLDSAKQIALQLNNQNMVYSCDFMKAMYYYNVKDFQKAIDSYTDCLAFARTNNFLPGIGNNFLNIAACEAELGRPVRAAAHLDSSAKYLDLSVWSVSRQMYFENYAEVYRQTRNYEKAFAYKDSVAVIKDSLYQADNIRQIEFRQARYNYEKKQHEVDQLEKDKKLQQLTIRQKSTINYVLTGSAATGLLLSVLFYRNYRQRQKLQQQRINELETQQQLTATENVLKGEEQERTRLAKDLHDGLGGMLSGIKYSLNTMKGNLIMTPENARAFERSMDMLDSSIQEMRRVAHNMMPEALVKFGLDTALKDFSNDINQCGALKISYQSLGLENEVIEQTTAITIYRIVQELINNTMKHAAAKTAIVQVTKSDGHLSVTVEDDGKGFDSTFLKQSTTRIHEQTGRGIGWSNIQNRIDFLKGTFDVKSENGKGTSVYIELDI